MRRSLIALAAVCALASTFETVTSAQQDKRATKHPKQTQDRGIDDADLSVIPDKNAAGAQVIQHTDGSVSSILDASFLEATVAVKNADGTITYRCFHGLPAAANHLKQVSEHSDAATKAAPALEVK